MNKDALLALSLDTILSHALDYEWSLQGLGMLRLYLSKSVRLHLWDPGMAAPHVSVIHDHPWDFESHVIAGEITDRIWRTENPTEHMRPNYLRQSIVCGPGGHAFGEPEPVLLRVHTQRTFAAGVLYHGRATELHDSRPAPGTVTLIARTFRENTEHARVCFPIGTSWVSAEPRPATGDEVLHFVKLSRARLAERLRELGYPGEPA